MYKPCYAQDLIEYWGVDRHTGEIVHHYYYSGPRRDRNHDHYYYCTDKYGSGDYVDLCRNCMVKYGLLW